MPHLDPGLQLHARALVHEVAEQRVGLLVEHRLLLALGVGHRDDLHVFHFHAQLAHEGGEDRQTGVARSHGDAAALDFRDLGRPRRIGAVDESHRALLQRDAHRADRHAVGNAAHHGGGIDIGNRTVVRCDQLRDSRRAAAFLDFDFDAFGGVEALVAGDKKRRVFAVERPVEPERELFKLGLSQRLTAAQNQYQQQQDALHDSSFGFKHYMVPEPSRTRWVTCQGIRNASRNSTM